MKWLDADMSAGRPSVHSHMSPLDGLRGLAVLLVFFHHSLSAASVVAANSVEKALMTFIGAGWMGVDVFFALSGFLITGILLDSKGAPGYFLNFYAKRTLRIFPLYYFALFLTFVILGPFIERLYGTDPSFSQIEHAQAWFWSYLQNWYFAVLGHGSNVPVTHLWSLAVEEQFYLVWPVVVYVSSARRTVAIAATICVLAPLLRYCLLSASWSDAAVYMATVTRIDALLVGALLAAWLRAGFALPSSGICTLLAPAVFVVGLAFAAFIDHGLRRNGTAFQVIGFSVISCSAMLVILLAISKKTSSYLVRFLNLRSLRVSGKYSYAMYVYHPPILWGLAALLRSRGLLLPTAHLFTLKFVGFAMCTLACTYFVSIASWHSFERHFLKFKKYFSGNRVTPTPSDSSVAAVDL